MRNKDIQLFNETLIKMRFFKFLSEGWKKSMCSRAHLVTYKKGDTVIKKGNPAGAFFMIGFGSFSLTGRDPQAPEAEIELRELLSGDFFGGNALITGEKRSFSVVAKEDSLVYALDKANFLAMITDSREVREMVEIDSIGEMPAGPRSEEKGDVKEGKSLISKLKGYLKLKQKG
jgi:CRP-like cAMP-binding protein